CAMQSVTAALSPLSLHDALPISLIGVGGLCLASHAPDRRLLVERGAHSAGTSAPASASAPEAALDSPAARSRSTRWSTMRSTSWKSWPLTTRYLPLTTIVGVASTPRSEEHT